MNISNRLMCLTNLSRDTTSREEFLLLLKEKLIEEGELNLVDLCIEFFLGGYKAALKDYSYMKDGVTYVGNCGTEYKQAVTEIQQLLYPDEFRKGEDYSKM